MVNSNIFFGILNSKHASLNKKEKKKKKKRYGLTSKLVPGEEGLLWLLLVVEMIMNGFSYCFSWAYLVSFFLFSFLFPFLFFSFPFSFSLIFLSSLLPYGSQHLHL